MMKSNNFGADKIYKILLIGESNVGKTSLILRYTDNEFKESGIGTCGVDVKFKYVSLNNTKIKLDIWDTAGQERFRGLARNYFKGGNGFILVYDITNKKSFDMLKGWMNDVKEKSEKEYKLLLIGNKKDRDNERQVDIEAVKEFSKKNKVSFLEVSAKTGEGVENMFNTLVQELLTSTNLGGVNDESDADITFNSLDISKVRDNKHNCNCMTK